MASDHAMSAFLLLYLGILLPVVVPNADISVHIHVEYTSDFKAYIQCWPRKHPTELASYHLYFTKTNEINDSVACKNVSEPLHVRCYEHGKDQHNHWIETYVLPTQDHQNVPSTDTIERCYQNGTGEVCWIFHVYDDSAANCNVSDTNSIIGTVTTFLPPLLSDDKFNSANRSKLLESLELLRTLMFENVTCARITGTLTYKGERLPPPSCVPPIISTGMPNVDPIYGMIGDNPTYVTASFSLLIALAAALFISICVSCVICFCFCYRHRYKDRYEIQENTDVNHEAFTTM